MSDPYENAPGEGWDRLHWKTGDDEEDESASQASLASEEGRFERPTEESEFLYTPYL